MFFYIFIPNGIYSTDFNYPIVFKFYLVLILINIILSLFVHEWENIPNNIYYYLLFFFDFIKWFVFISLGTFIYMLDDKDSWRIYLFNKTFVLDFLNILYIYIIYIFFFFLGNFFFYNFRKNSFSSRIDKELYSYLLIIFFFFYILNFKLWFNFFIYMFRNG